MSEQETAKQEDLRSFGWAPGDYIFTCIDCGKKPIMPIEGANIGDKRAWRCEKHAREAKVNHEKAKLQGEAESLRLAATIKDQEISQILGKALGYPWLKDDQRNFPGATEADGVCVGDHVAESLATEAAARIATLEKRVIELLVANNNEVQRRRDVEREKERLQEWKDTVSNYATLMQGYREQIEKAHQEGFVLGLEKAKAI